MICLSEKFVCLKEKKLQEFLMNYENQKHKHWFYFLKVLEIYSRESIWSLKIWIIVYEGKRWSIKSIKMIFIPSKYDSLN